MNKIQRWDNLTGKQKDALILSALKPLVADRSLGSDMQFSYNLTWAMLLLKYMPPVVISHIPNIAEPFTVTVQVQGVMVQRNIGIGTTLPDALCFAFLRWRGVLDTTGKVIEQEGKSA